MATSSINENVYINMFMLLFHYLRRDMAFELPGIWAPGSPHPNLRILWARRNSASLGAPGEVKTSSLIIFSCLKNDLSTEYQKIYERMLRMVEFQLFESTRILNDLEFWVGWFWSLKKCSHATIDTLASEGNALDCSHQGWNHVVSSRVSLSESGDS